jgi:hypothetical protein
LILNDLLGKKKIYGAWRSLEAHLLWEQGVGGSNPLAPTKIAFSYQEEKGLEVDRLEGH